MPSGHHKSRTFRRVFTVVPGNRVALHYKKRKPHIAHCGNCGSPLKGVPRERPYKMRNLAKTQKRPERPYGGVLCSKCLRSLIKEKVHQHV